MKTIGDISQAVAGARNAPAVVAAVCALGVAAGIFALTQQAPEDTVAQSGFVNDLLVGLLGGIEGLYDPQAETWLGIGVRHWAHTVEFGALGLAVALSVVLARGGGRLSSIKPTSPHSGRSSIALSNLPSSRSTGKPSSLPSNRSSVISSNPLSNPLLSLLASGGIALAVCAACSVADQLHKLFVPARHFDWFDLCMDALGYGCAIAAVVAVAWVLSATRHK